MLCRFTSPNSVTPYRDYIMKQLTIGQAANDAQKKPEIPQDKILVLGCGTSRLSEELVDEGFKHENVVSVDWSSNCIKIVKDRYKDSEYEKMTFVCADARALPKEQFGDATFDCVLDKGLLDAMCCTNHANV